jgi:hypothetical protein
MQGTAEFHHQIADARHPQAEPVCDDTTALATPVDRLDPQPAVREGLIQKQKGVAGAMIEALRGMRQTEHLMVDFRCECKMCTFRTHGIRDPLL